MVRPVERRARGACAGAVLAAPHMHGASIEPKPVPRATGGNCAELHPHACSVHRFASDAGMPRTRERPVQALRSAAPGTRGFWTRGDGAARSRVQGISRLVL